MDDPDPTNNRDHYYLPDAMGGNVGLYYDNDGDESTSRVAVFNHFDAFGVPMSKTSPAVGTKCVAWPSGAPPCCVHSRNDWLPPSACARQPVVASSSRRGQEGSITDRDSGLVYMQSRHYDPSIGRFIQADSLSMGSFSTQGMNRYTYAENDPVNKSDPGGRSTLDTIAGIALAGLALMLPVLGTWALVGAVVGGAAGAGLILPLLGFFGAFASAMAALLGAFVRFTGDERCYLSNVRIGLSTFGLISSISSLATGGGQAILQGGAGVGPWLDATSVGGPAVGAILNRGMDMLFDLIYDWAI